jgi:hypothetical protein
MRYVFVALLAAAAACGGLIDDEDDLAAGSVRVTEPGTKIADAGSTVSISADGGAIARDAVADVFVFEASATDAPIDLSVPDEGLDAEVDTGAEASVCDTTYVVDAVHGNDANAGTCDAPWKTLTKAVSIATSGESIGVMPGTYDETNGEVFPLKVASGVSIIGDEAHRGTADGGAVAVTGTIATGDGGIDTLTALFEPGAGSTIAGLRIQCKGCGFFGNAVQIAESNVTLRSNTVTDSTRIGVYIVGGTHDVIVDNVFARSYLGISFRAGGDGSRVERNVIRENQYGIDYDHEGGDLGGGDAGSVGQNVLSCNGSSDLWTVSSVTIPASNNYWDHVPPTRGHGGGLDIYAYPATLTVANPQLAANPCP